VKIRSLEKCCICLIGLLLSAVASADMLAPIAAVPGSVPYSTKAIGLNDAGTVAGSYQTADLSVHGFYGTPDGRYSYLDAGTNGWQPRGINNQGFVTGYSNANSGPPWFEFEIWPSGAIAPITSNGVQLQGIVQGVNAAGYFVGDYQVSNPAAPGQVNGFFGREGHYVGDITLPFPTRLTRARAINDRGDVAGFFRKAGDAQKGFLIRDGVVVVITYPDPQQTGTVLSGMNDQGWMAGQWTDAADLAHSFILSPDLTTFTNIIVPGSPDVQAFAINNAGDVAVFSDVGSYIYCSKSGAACQRLNGSPVATSIVTVPSGSFATFPCASGCVSPVSRGPALVSPDPRVAQ
jgi:uncharacterized membrane protein